MKININTTQFLDKEKEVTHKAILTLASEGEWTESKKFTKDDGTPSNQFEMHVKLENGDLRSTIINYGNVKLLVQAFGDETKKWIGKEVRAWKTKSEKAKTGYTYIYVPIDWERDDTGEWVIPEGYPQKFVSDTEQAINEYGGQAEINPDDIPF